MVWINKAFRLSLLSFGLAAFGGELSAGLGVAANVPMGHDPDPSFADPVFVGELRYSWEIEQDRIYLEAYLIHISSIPENDDGLGDNFAGAMLRFK